MLALPYGAAETGPRCVDPCVERMPRKEWRQLPRDGDRAHARPAAAVRNAEGLVQVEMADVGADVPRAAQADLRVHVRAVHVDLPAMLVNDRGRCPPPLLRRRHALTGR